MKILIRGNDDIVIMEENELSYECLTEIFLRDMYRTVYVMHNKSLSGIVTLGNFRRNQLQGKDLINRNFTSFSSKDENENEMICFFDENEKINAIPIIGEDGNIVKEYYREIPPETVDLSDVEAVCNGIVYMLAKYRLIYCVVPYMSVEDRKRAHAFSEMHKNRIRIVELIPSSLKDEDYVFVCDFSPEHFRIREVLYRNWDIDFVCYDINAVKEYEQEYKTYVTAGLFNRVAVAGDDLFTKMIRKVHSDAFVLQTDKIGWNEQENCYEYYGELPDDVECVFMSMYFYSRMFIYEQKRYIPVFEFSEVIRGLFFSQKEVDEHLMAGENVAQIGRFASEFDVIYNIIPKLQAGIEQTIQNKRTSVRGG